MSSGDTAAPNPYKPRSEIQDPNFLAGRDNSINEISHKLSQAANDQPRYLNLGEEMICRINDLLPNLDERDLYEVEVKQDGLVARRKEDDSPAEMADLSVGGQLIISHAAALVAADIMPATPPLIGDTMFGRVDLVTRERIFEVIKQNDRQVLLFSVDAELEVFDISPLFKLEQSGKGRESKIVAAD